MKKILYAIAVLVLLMVGGYYFYQKFYPKIPVTEKFVIANPQKENSSQLANPASVNCVKAGGTSTIETREDGSQYGLCYFDDNRACEEWAMMQGNCPVGGVKTTGYDTIDQKFCAWSGGQTYAVTNSVCTFKDGTKCSTKDFYDGSCPVSK